MAWHCNFQVVLALWCEGCGGNADNVLYGVTGFDNLATGCGGGGGSGGLWVVGCGLRGGAGLFIYLFNVLYATIEYGM